MSGAGRGPAIATPKPRHQLRTETHVRPRRSYLLERGREIRLGVSSDAWTIGAP
jgi:hypothetical protein